MTEPLRVGFIGAGAVNFGGGEGPWDHASRLERIDGLKVVGVADPDMERARRKLDQRSSHMYEGAEVFSDFRAMLERRKPQAVWIGVPPNAHGSIDPGKDIELQCMKAGVHMFVEKPLSAFRPETVRQVARRLQAGPVIISVGYMFRYAVAINTVRRILEETIGTGKVFMGRYNCAYSEIRKDAWWDIRAGGGPIVEQATHFVDLARYLFGEPKLATVRALSIKLHEPAGVLRDVPKKDSGALFGEDVPDAFKPPCATAAVWKFQSGALGSLTHGTLLHAEKYETEIEVWSDGLRVVLRDPYGQPRLSVRRPGTESTEEIPLSEDDPYLTEDQAFVDAVRSGDGSGIQSTYDDALKTFEFSWAIADAATSR